MPSREVEPPYGVRVTLAYFSRLEDPRIDRTNTTNRGGLVARARLDRRYYPVGKKVSAKEVRAIRIERDDFHGDWNYSIRPRTEMS